MYGTLTPEELSTCETLRILPEVYFHIKRTMLQAVAHYGPFKKREAQTWFRIDVNKICIIYDWYKSIGWIPNTGEWSSSALAPSDAPSSHSASSVSVCAAGMKRKTPPGPSSPTDPSSTQLPLLFGCSSQSSAQLEPESTSAKRHCTD
eukprot:jgi/Hompol1/6119/HPOL_000712-RA